MVDDARLDLEFAYTPYDNCCKDVYSPFYLCRRERGHQDEHAAGYGADRLRWP